MLERQVRLERGPERAQQIGDRWQRTTRCNVLDHGGRQRLRAEAARQWIRQIMMRVPHGIGRVRDERCRVAGSAQQQQLVQPEPVCQLAGVELDRVA